MWKDHICLMRTGRSGNVGVQNVKLVDLNGSQENIIGRFNASLKLFCLLKWLTLRNIHRNRYYVTKYRDLRMIYFLLDRN